MAFLCRRSKSARSRDGRTCPPPEPSTPPPGPEDSGSGRESVLPTPSEVESRHGDVLSCPCGSGPAEGEGCFATGPIGPSTRSPSRPERFRPERDRGAASRSRRGSRHGDLDHAHAQDHVARGDRFLGPALLDRRPSRPVLRPGRRGFRSGSRRSQCTGCRGWCRGWQWSRGGSSLRAR